MVSRETSPPPDVAAVLFGPRLPLARRYADVLATTGVVRGLIGPREVDRLWDRHLLNCAVLTDGIETHAHVCDVGSGAGLPGVVLAIARPDLTVTLLEPLLRRAAFLEETVADLALANAGVVRARAEEHDGRYDVVTARAVAPLDRLVRIALPLCRPGGSLLAMKGERAGDELAVAEPELVRLGASHWHMERFGGDLVSPAVTAVRVVAGDRSVRHAGAAANVDKRRRRRRKGRYR